MGERESSIALSENNFDDLDNESKGEVSETDEFDDFDYLDAKTLSDGLTKVDQDFLSGKIKGGVVEYFDNIDEVGQKLINQNKNYPKAIEMINFICDSTKVIYGDIQRRRGEIEKNIYKKENLAKIESQWQIDLAKSFLNHKKDRSAAIPIINIYLERFTNTLETLRFDQTYIEGVIRGVRGLLATIKALEGEDHQIIAPTAEQDAEEKIDLISINPLQERYFWQIKTAKIDRDPYMLEIKRKMTYSSDDDEDYKKFVKDANILFEAAKRAQIKDGLTTKAVYITIPEPRISGKFEPKQPIRNSFKEFLGE